MLFYTTLNFIILLPLEMMIWNITEIENGSLKVLLMQNERTGDKVYFIKYNFWKIQIEYYMKIFLSSDVNINSKVLKPFSHNPIM